MERDKILMLLNGLKATLEESAGYITLHRQKALRDSGDLELSEYLGSDLYHWLSVLSISRDHHEQMIGYITTVTNHLKLKENDNGVD